MSLLVLLLLCVPLAAPMAIGAERKPNILIIVADDLGYGELGCQGNPEIPTPNIDSIARSGIRCTSGYVTAPVCSPSRAGFMTGRYQTRFGHELNAIGRQNVEENIGLPLGETTLANRLKTAGYVTGMAGKWHLGASEKYHPQRRGFDEFFGFLHEGHFYVPPPYPGVTSFLRTNNVGSGTTKKDGDVIWSTHLRNNEPPYDDGNPLLRGGQPVTENTYLTEAFTREAVDFIERHSSEPFFFYLPYNAPHSPMQGLEKYLQRFAAIPDVHRRIFAAMIASLDDGVGQVLAKVRQSGLENDTLIFFFSDNGGPTAELTSSNLPLSGGKGTLQEGGIRIPFIVQWKNHLPAGSVYAQPVGSMDIHATALAAAAVTATSQLDGVNLLPYLNGKNSEAPHQNLYWRYGPQAALRHGNWKLFRTGASQPWKLFDLSADIGELNDLAAQQPELINELGTAWNQWNAQQVPPLWSGGAAGKKGKK